MKKAAYFVFSLFVISYLLLVAPQAFAQTPPSNTNSDVPNNLHNWTQTVMIEVMSALTCQLAGIDPTNSKQSCLGVDSASGKIGFTDPSAGSGGGGAIGVMGNMISMLYTPPIHTVDYFQNLAQGFGIAKPAIAQQTGTGFDGLKPILGLWTVFRNIVYLAFVVVFIVIGLAIMLRVKIDPRTVMTIQNQIPKIIVGILLVTFSFAIGGFLIDLMWVLIYLIYSTISQVGDVSQFNPVNLQGTNPLGAVGVENFLSITFDASRGVGEFIGSLLGGGGGLAGAGAGAAAGAIGFSVLGPLGIITTIAGIIVGLFGVGNTMGVIGGVIAFIIIAIALLVALFRLWILLLMAYIWILLDIVFAPFWIMGSLIPGSPVGVGGWFRDLGANLLAFPTTIFMFLIGKVFVDAFGTGDKAGQFVPPLIGNPGDTSAIGALIGLAIILIIPTTVSQLKTFLKAPKIETGLGATIGAGTGALGGITKSTVGAGSLAIAGDPFNPKTTGLAAIFRGWQRKNA